MPKKKPVDLFEDQDTTHLGNAETGHLRAYVERIERVQEEIDALTSDRKEIYAEAKGTGFDVKQMRKVVAIRKQDRDKWREEQQVLDLYLSALGVL
jgi:uncharacterized protein (UPF0335 family)